MRKPETVTNCGDVGLQVIVAAVRLYANKYIAMNHECSIA